MMRTPLFDVCRRYGARTIDFGGWELPVQYSGIIDEHETVRSAVGLFDVSHMGEIWIHGRRALEALQMLTVNDASRLVPGGVQYSAMANTEGGLVDDILVYCFAPDSYLLVVNAANTAKDLQWMKAHTTHFEGTRIVDRSRGTALLALQGPKAQDVLSRLTYTDLPALGYYHFISAKVAGMEVTISRTGYTGEDGFELFIDSTRAADLWEELMAMGEGWGIKPCGLGCRDTLRLEVCYALYGQDIDEATSPLEAGLGWITKLEKGDFIGREALRRQKEEGIPVSLAAFVMEERGIPRHDYLIMHEGEMAGRVTSGTMSPSLKVGIGLGYVSPSLAAPDSRFSVRIRDREVPALVVKPPFYRFGTVKRER